MNRESAAEDLLCGIDKWRSAFVFLSSSQDLHVSIGGWLCGFLFLQSSWFFLITHICTIIVLHLRWRVRSKLRTSLLVERHPACNWLQHQRARRNRRMAVSESRIVFAREPSRCAKSENAEKHGSPYSQQAIRVLGARNCLRHRRRLVFQAQGYCGSTSCERRITHRTERRH